jgi:hypothetical protein
LPRSQLTPLQERVLGLLAEMNPRWTLTGGGALAGVHLGQRATRDLDLFWHGRSELGTIRGDVVRTLERAKLAVEPVQTALAFARLRVGDGREEVLVDLVAESSPSVEQPVEATVAGVRLLVDTPHEILVNKLCTLLSRSELRDLRDVRDLLRHGGELERALADAPRKDAGFSPLMVAWILRERPLAAQARTDDFEQEVGELERFRDELVARLLRAAAPE